MRHGSRIDPPNRFESIRVVDDLDHVEGDDEWLAGRFDRRIEYLDDDSQSIVVANDSPDIPFSLGLNPYRGCVHGCSYCYARNYHEFLGLNAGLDFETKIYVKRRAPELLRRWMSRDRVEVEPIMLSGVTDCYQPAERRFRLTRGCLEVFLECEHPVGLITKNALVARDVDILGELAARKLVHVAISITTLDVDLARSMEPRTSSPEARLRAIATLSAAGVPVRVMTAPIVPGLNDSEIPSLLEAARSAGAVDAGWTLLRLPLTVEPVFREWLVRERPMQASKVESLLRRSRAGKVNQSEFGKRMRGEGEWADQIRSLFDVFRRKLAFPGMPELDGRRYRPCAPPGGQRRLF